VNSKNQVLYPWGVGWCGAGLHEGLQFRNPSLKLEQSDM
jgi:hypothetical protein